MMPGLLDPAGFPIDTSRPKLQNRDGSYSTEETITVGFGNKYYNIPTIWNGVRVDERAATLLARDAMQRGATFPNFDSLEEAVREARRRSEAIGKARR